MVGSSPVGPGRMFLSYACPHGRALIDRRLYVPQSSWCADRTRCEAVGIRAISASVTFTNSRAPRATDEAKSFGTPRLRFGNSMGDTPFRW